MRRIWEEMSLQNREIYVMLLDRYEAKWQLKVMPLWEQWHLGESVKQYSSDVDFSFCFRHFKLLDWLRVKHLKYGTVLPGKWMKIFEQQRIMLIFIYVFTLNLYFLYFRPQSNVHQRLPSFNIEDLTQIWIFSSSKLDKNVSVDVVRGAAA